MEVFQTRYKDNIEWITTKKDLESTFQKENETFVDFTERWREKMSELMERPNEE